MAVAVGSLFDHCGRTAISWHAQVDGWTKLEEPFLLYFFSLFSVFRSWAGTGWKGGSRDRKGVGHKRRLSIIFKASDCQRMGFLCRLRIGFVCGQPYYLHTLLLVLDLLFYFASYTGDYWGLLCYGKAGVCFFFFPCLHFISFSFHFIFFFLSFRAGLFGDSKRR